MICMPVVVALQNLLFVVRNCCVIFILNFLLYYCVSSEGRQWEQHFALSIFVTILDSFLKKRAKVVHNFQKMNPKLALKLKK